MQVTRYDGSDERKTLVAMITDRTALGMISQHWDGNLFSTKALNLIGGWCVEHLHKHNEAPGRAIEDYLVKWGQYHGDKSTVQAVEDLLAVASAEYQSRPASVPSDHAIDVAARAFRTARLTKLHEAIGRDLSTGELEQAEQRVTSHMKLELGTGSFCDPINDRERLLKAFRGKSESVVEYPGAVGEFFAPALRRGNFVTFVGREKIGKSFVLQDIAWTAMLQRRRVCYFQIGDLSEEQQLVRLAVRATRHPEDAQTCRIPQSLEVADRKHHVVHEEQVFDDGVGVGDATKAMDEVIYDRVKSKRTYLHLACLAADEVDVNGIRAQVGRLIHRDWVPDLVVIDYADLVDPPPGLRDAREKINAVWKALRRLALTPHCLVLTATQANRAGYDVEWLGMKHVGEEKRKLAHCTHAIGMNQNQEEEEDGVMRFNWLVNRGRKPRPVWVAGSLGIASPLMLSSF